MISLLRLRVEIILKEFDWVLLSVQGSCLVETFEINFLLIFSNDILIYDIY